MRRLALAFLLVACGGSEDPHVVGTCSGWTDNMGQPYTGQCEAACKKQPAASGKTCDTPLLLHCNAFDFDGTEGCCVPTADNVIKFSECAPGSP
ncbi:MAG TPA: hypothetical protein VL326_14220 [Kofleriaceae bacterium]|jgi:hypothetical protein|nr:hypothetical protein [Kofleriaceae bacterium]